MGMEAATYEMRLASHRDFVSRAFHDAFRIAGVSHGPEAGSGAPEEPPAPPPAPASGDELGAGSRVGQRMDLLLEGYRVQNLPEASRARLEALLPRALEAARATTDPEQTAVRLLDLLEQIAQRSSYLALLAEYPQTVERVARIVGASPWASQYLKRYPLLLDSLIEWHSLLEPLDIAHIAQRLRDDLDACVLPDGKPDIEQQMNLMRDVQHQVTFQLLAQDLEGLLTVERLADGLSALADAMLEETVVRTWPLAQPRGQEGTPPAPPRFAVIAYGKLGGKELGYASDLDLVFVYDDPREDAVELYAKLGRRMSSWLSTLTSSGRLYEIDLRLRPDGDVGLLAVSLTAFEEYQSRHAWSWEHQAITRARYAAGDPDVGARFEEIRRAILLRPRDRRQLKAEVSDMRRKTRAGHPNQSADFDLKHDRGGMVDVEFITQYLVLSEAGEHPVLLDNLGNIALLRLAAEAGLIPAPLAAAVADAYRDFRRMQHALRLQGAQKARVEPELFHAQRQAVLELWNTVIGD